MTHEGFLASVPLFAMLDAGERNDLLRATKPFSFPAGHVIFEQGDAPDGRSYGRMPDGDGPFRTLGTPTPGSPNRP